MVKPGRPGETAHCTSTSRASTPSKATVCARATIPASLFRLVNDYRAKGLRLVKAELRHCVASAMNAGQASGSATVLSRQKALQKPKTRPSSSRKWVTGLPE